MVGFVTLTCSRAILGEELEGQFQAVKDRRLVSQFVRKFREVVGRRMAFLAIMEFHKKSKQAHFHLVLDGCARLPREALMELQAWCQEHMGTFDYKYMSSDRAVRYCLKYITKGAYEGLPEWCLDYKGRIRPYTASRGFWHDSKPRPEPESAGKSRVQRTLRVRIERCKDAGVIGLTETVAEDGAISQRYAFTLEMPFEVVRELAADVVQDESERELIRQARRGFSLTVAEFEALAWQVFRVPGMARRAAAGSPGP